MRRILKVTLAVLALFAVVSAVPAGAVPSESRMALVIGNASYRFGALATAANDAGLIAQTLRAAIGASVEVGMLGRPSIELLNHCLGGYSHLMDRTETGVFF